MSQGIFMIPGSKDREPLHVCTAAERELIDLPKHENEA